jgi:transposase
MQGICNKHPYALQSILWIGYNKLDRFLRSYTIKPISKGAINMTETKQKRKPRKYTDEFKQQLVDLYHSGKRRCDICREYDIAHSLFDKWVKQAEHSGSFHEKDNRTPEQEELLKLRKENQQLKMENDILKQAALILGRK